MDFIGPLQEKLHSMGVGFVKALPLILIAIIVLFVTWLLTKLASRLLRASLSKSGIRTSLKELFDTLLGVAIWIFGIMVAITIIFPSLTPGKLVAAVGLGSVAVGLAFKDIFENFFAGILIMLREPMRIGDFIECEGVEGKVERISLRESYIRKTDDQLVLVPNSYLFNNPVYIRTDRQKRRFEIIVGIAYGENVDESRQIIHDAVAELDIVNTDRGVGVFAREFNSSSIDFTVRWWANSKPIDMHESRDKVVAAIKQALDEAGIEIPFPYRTLTFPEPLVLQQENPE